MMSFLSRFLYILPAGGRQERINLHKRRFEKGLEQTKGLTPVQAFQFFTMEWGSVVPMKLERVMGEIPGMKVRLKPDGQRGRQAWR
jgi:hypothetical protein